MLWCHVKQICESLPWALPKIKACVSHDIFEERKGKQHALACGNITTRQN